jgi:hypothetical protein
MVLTMEFFHYEKEENMIQMNSWLVIKSQNLHQICLKWLQVWILLLFIPSSSKHVIQHKVKCLCESYVQL